MRAIDLRGMAAGLPKTAQRVRGMFFGWYMAGLGAVLMALASAPIWHGLPVWSPVLRNAFDWTTVQMSWAFAVTRVEGGLLGPLEGLLVQRLGTRRVVFIGLTVLGTGLVLFSRIEELWQLYAAFFIMSLGAALSTWLPMMTLTNHWFVRHKARAMSIVFEGFAIGGIAVPLLLAWAIGGADPEISGAVRLEEHCPVPGPAHNCAGLPSDEVDTQSPRGHGPEARRRIAERAGTRHCRRQGSTGDAASGKTCLEGSPQDQAFLDNQPRPRVILHSILNDIRSHGADAG